MVTKDLTYLLRRLQLSAVEAVLPSLYEHAKAENWGYDQFLHAALETAATTRADDAAAASGRAGGGEAADDGPRDPDTLSSDDIAASAPDQGARADLPAPLRRLLDAAAQRQRVSPQEALAEAVLAHGVAVLGTREAYALLGVLLTWKRADGLYALTPAREWRPIAALPSRSAGRIPHHHRE